MFNEFQIIGHRGLPTKYPENTILSFDKAIEVGATMVQFDLQLTADNHLAVVHDRTTTRIGDKKLEVCQTLRSDLETVIIRNGDFTDKLIFFDDILHQYKESINYYVEIKTFNHSNIDYKSKLVFYTINEIVKHGLQSNCLIASFDVECLRIAKRLGYINLGTSYLKSPNPFPVKISCPKHSLVRKPVEGLTFTWTVNNEKRMRKLIDEYKVNGIISDRVDKLADVCNLASV